MSAHALLARAPVVPVLTIERLDDAVPLARALVAGGLPVLEITLRTEAALGAIERVSEEVEGAVVGAGTILTPRDLAAAARAGAAFAISPGATPALLEAGRDAAIPYIPAVATASELMLGLEHGYTCFKFFPAESAGGVGALKSFAGPFAAARFCPTGGIDLAKAPAYLALPNVLTVGGSWMAPAALVAGRAWLEIEALARTAAALRSR